MTGQERTTLRSLTSSNQIEDRGRRCRRHRHRPEPKGLEETLPDDLELLLAGDRDSIAGRRRPRVTVAMVVLLRHRAFDTWP